MTAEEMNILAGDEETLTRFWNKIHIPYPNDPDACWEWTAYRDKDGCGKFSLMVNGKHKGKRAPRLMWILEHDQDIPEGLQVQHTCDDEGCTNPKHLKLGTHKDNAMDRKARGRFDTARRGEAHPNAKLTSTKVIKICKDYFHRNKSIRSIALKNKVSTNIIRDIVLGKIWKHVTKTHRPQTFKTAYQKIKERNQKMYELYDEGYTYQQIAVKFNLCKKYVCDVVRVLRRANGENVRLGNRQVNRKRIS